jgi:hypothetical protein
MTIDRAPGQSRGMASGDQDRSRIGQQVEGHAGFKSCCPELGYFLFAHVHHARCFPYECFHRRHEVTIRDERRDSDPG